MKRIIATLSVQLIFAAATPALAAHHHPAPYDTVNSGWGTPSN